MEDFRTYPKIETLYDRDPETFKVVEGKFRRPEFAEDITWDVTEKVDGTNVRVLYRPASAESRASLGVIEDCVTFGGRTAKAQLQTRLLEHLQATFTTHNLARCFPGLALSAALFGEGYGPGIQKVGPRYRSDGPSFRLFDVFVQDHPGGHGIWLLPDAVDDVAEKLGIKPVPRFGRMSTKDALCFVHPAADRDPSFSAVAAEEGQADLLIEGVVATSSLGLLDRQGRRLQWKLKLRDFA